MTNTVPNVLRPVAGAIAGALLGAAAVASGLALRQSTHPAATSPAPTATEVHSSDASPARVAAISKVLDVFRTGAAAGPGIINGVVGTVGGSQTLPPPLDAVQTQVLDQAAKAFQQASVQGPAAIDQFASSMGALSCLNPAVTPGIEAAAATLDSIATEFGSLIQPADRTLSQTATLLRQFEEPGGCR